MSFKITFDCLNHPWLSIQEEERSVRLDLHYYRYDALRWQGVKRPGLIVKNGKERLLGSFQYKKEDELGKGSYKACYSIQSKNAKSVVLLREYCETVEQIDLAAREFFRQHQFSRDCASIQAAFFAFLIPSKNGNLKFLTVQPKCKKLSDLLPIMTDGEKFRMLIQVVEAIRFLHHSDISHGDIKIENVLFRKGRFYLSDFGGAYHKKDDTYTWTYTPDYRATDSFGSTHPSKSYDIFSLGVLILKTFSTFNVLSDSCSDIQTSKIKYIRRCELRRRTLPNTPLNDLAYKMTRHESERRPKISKVLRKLKDLALNPNASLSRYKN